MAFDEFPNGMPSGRCNISVIRDCEPIIEISISKTERQIVIQPAKDRMDIIEQLLKREIQIDAVILEGYYGYTSLTFAIENGNLEMVKRLHYGQPQGAAAERRPTDYATPHTFTWTAGQTFTFTLSASAQTQGDTIQFTNVAWAVHRRPR